MARVKTKGKPRMVDGLLITDTTIFSAQEDGTVLICDSSIPTCTLCNTARALYVNRHGKTRCQDCDADYRKNLEAKASEEISK